MVGIGVAVAHAMAVWSPRVAAEIRQGQRPLTDADRAILAHVEHDPAFQVVQLPSRISPYHQALDRAIVQADNVIRRAMYEAAVSGTGAAKAKFTALTIEGAPLATYVKVQDGSIEIIRDYSHDVYSLSTVLVQHPASWELGVIGADGTFAPVSASTPSGRRLVLRYLVDGVPWEF